VGRQRNPQIWQPTPRRKLTDQAIEDVRSQEDARDPRTFEGNNVLHRP
jgi:hypothetical protein